VLKKGSQQCLLTKTSPMVLPIRSIKLHSIQLASMYCHNVKKGKLRKILPDVSLTHCFCSLYTADRSLYSREELVSAVR
jgi:hypothetical protein